MHRFVSVALAVLRIWRMDETLRHTPRKRVAILTSAAGCVAQESLHPILPLERAGIETVLCGLDAGPARFEPVGLAMAFVERWMPTRRLLARFAPQGRFERAMLEEVDAYDAFILPGGFGAAFADFCRDTRLHRVLETAIARGKIVALQCHSVIVGTWLRDERGAPFLRDKQVTCWPAAYERWLGLLPGLGRYFMPFGRPVQRDVEAHARVAFNGWRIPFNRHVVQDGRLLTSIGPWSATALGHAIANAL